MGVRVVVIGFGAVGRQLHDLVADGAAGEAEVVGFLVRDLARYREIAARQKVPLVASVSDALALHPDVVVEAAGHDAMRSVVPAFLAAGCDVIAISAGALADPDLVDEIRAAAERGAARLRVPSGAIAGLDAISAAAVGRIERVRHTVRKPPATLLPPDEAAAVVAAGEPRELYEGTAREAAIRFPANVNVVAAVSLAGIGLDRTMVQVVADPGVTRNTHEVLVEGAFGRLEVTIANTPSENPKTGVIVAQSLARVLRAYGETIVVGA
ncbi:MAG TPA: aspartate dehydrogenase [Candidatus Saccharimonadales bacterium]|nr:aspartate dehydrogenase [Candidatus Saccharimonadales bacterium]